MDGFLSGRAASRPALGIWCSVGDPLLAEALASVGPDYICVDMQHGSSHEGNLVSILQAVTAGGSVPIARVAENNQAAIMKSLDAGAAGVIVPLVESGAEAAQAVAACRYPPAGRRSYGPFRASIHAGTPDARALEQVACIAMVETRAGLDNLDEIAATDGLTGIYVGPSDLSLALGLPPGSFDAPEFDVALAAIQTACKRNDLAAGIHCYDGTTAARYVERGFDMITVSVELRTLRAALSTELGHARDASWGATA
jgi:4-hydroxy-2-oxoheptanedioate aldolase